tara:strand:+ start:1290 stop:1466 length:177 start_codon:yes stop_codon:yes gene_type:complete
MGNNDERKKTGPHGIDQEIRNLKTTKVRTQINTLSVYSYSNAEKIKKRVVIDMNIKRQ